MQLKSKWEKGAFCNLHGSENLFDAELADRRTWAPLLEPHNDCARAHLDGIELSDAVPRVTSLAYRH